MLYFVLLCLQWIFMLFARNETDRWMVNAFINHTVEFFSVQFIAIVRSDNMLRWTSVTIQIQFISTCISKWHRSQMQIICHIYLLWQHSSHGVTINEFNLKMHDFYSHRFYCSIYIHFECMCSLFIHVQCARTLSVCAQCTREAANVCRFNCSTLPFIHIFIEISQHLKHF